MYRIYIYLLVFLLPQFLSSALSEENQCTWVCPKREKIKRKNNIEIFFEFKKGVIKIPGHSRDKEDNKMIMLANGEIIPEVSLRLPSEFAVDPVAGNNANCRSKEFLKDVKELRKNIKCTPRPTIVDVVSNEGKVIPNKVLTKQCSGLCNGDKACVAVKTANTTLSVQILLKRGGIKCSTILVPQDVKCRCGCAVTKESCSPNQKYERKLCKCKCKNEVERNHCLHKATITQKHTWDQNSCSCVCTNQSPCTTGTYWDKIQCRCAKNSDNG